MIKAKEARDFTDKSKLKAAAIKDRQRKSRQAVKNRDLLPVVSGRILLRAKKGRNFLLCRSNKQACTQLKADGFGCILFFNIALIWW